MMAVDLQEVLRDLTNIMVNVREPVHLLSSITRFLDREMNVSKAAISVFDREKKHFSFYDSRGERKIPKSLVKLSLNNPLISWFSEYPDSEDLMRHCLDLSQLTALLGDSEMLKMYRHDAETLERIVDVMKGLGVQSCFPGYYKRKLIGLLFVGKKKNNVAFTREEIMFLQTIAGDIAITIKSAEHQDELEKKVHELEQSLSINEMLRTKDKAKFLQMIVTLAEIVDAKDKYTRGHSEEVARLGLACLKYMNLNFSEERKSKFSSALRLHDFGKVGIADEILKKPAALTNEEFEIMKGHPTIGADILETHDDLKDVAKIVRHHHEMYDGSGYPDGLKGEEIPLEARIICVVDSFHAMFSDRPYRKGLPLEVCMGELEKKKGIQFDPAAVEAFKHVVKNDLYITE